MIHKIYSDNKSFKTITFKPGFNVVLAERTIKSTSKDSRNGLGKSTFIEIIHFCLGGKKNETLNHDKVKGWTFILEIDLMGKKYAISRNITDSNKIIIEGDCSKWPVKPTIDEKTGRQIISAKDWTKCLGILMFNLQPIYDNQKYIPTFRSLISYFIRRNKIGGFLDPFQHFKSQKEWDKQVNNAFLLGLGWEFANKLQILRDRENVLKQIKQEAESGVLNIIIGNLGDLEALKIRLEEQSKQEEKSLKNFKVLPQYHNIENEANELTLKIHELVNQNIIDKRLIENYENSFKEEVDAKPDLIASIYEEAGLIFPNKVTKRIEDVQKFHKQVVINRKDFLNSEIANIKKLSIDRESLLVELTNKRTDLMQTLEKHGALEEYTKLQENHQTTIAQIKDISFRIENLKKFEQGRSAIAIEQELIYREASSDLNEREVQRKNAILQFNNNSKALYEAPGTLSINFTKSGFKFDVKIERSGSHGINNMKIFCYDLMLAKLWTKKNMESSISLIHDSNLFDGVDERQKAFALQLASTSSQKDDFQYICTLNSDTIPRKDFEANFDFDKYIVATFTDETEDGGLLGIRF